jgi:Trk K+ transport system NAD-binding subunit
MKVIVGAGQVGLTWAKVLSGRGAEVAVSEASDGSKAAREVPG